YGDKPAARRLRQRRGDKVMGLDTAGNHAATMEKDEARQWFAGGIRGSKKAIGKGASRARQRAVRSAHGRYIGAGELHQFGERLAAGFSARSRSIARRGGGPHGKKALCLGIEGHIGFRSQKTGAIVVYQI